MVPARIGLGYRLENRVIRNFAPCLNFLRRHSLGVRDRLRDSKDSKVADVTKGCARSRPHMNTSHRLRWCRIPVSTRVMSSAEGYTHGDIDWRAPGAGGRRPTCEGKPWATSG